MSSPVIVTKKHPKYPLILLRVFCHDNGYASRQVLRNTEYDHRWYGKYLPLLYARQVAKAARWAWVNKGKLLMELPHSICNIPDTAEADDEFSKYGVNINSKEGYALKKGYKKGTTTLSGEEILEQELYDEQ